MAHNIVDGLSLRGDIKFTYGTASILAPGDVTIDETSNDLLSDSGLETAILISLFSDRRASADDVIPDTSIDDLRGWWGDTLINFNIGSLLWLLGRSSTSETLPSEIEEYTNNALSWLIAEGIAKTITTTTVRSGTYHFKSTIVIQRSEAVDITFTYYYNWKSQTLGGSDATR